MGSVVSVPQEHSMNGTVFTPQVNDEHRMIHNHCNPNIGNPMNDNSVTTIHHMASGFNDNNQYGMLNSGCVSQPLHPETQRLPDGRKRLPIGFEQPDPKRWRPEELAMVSPLASPVPNTPSSLPLHNQNSSVSSNQEPMVQPYVKGKSLQKQHALQLKQIETQLKTATESMSRGEQVSLPEISKLMAQLDMLQKQQKAYEAQPHEKRVKREKVKSEKIVD